MCGNYKNYRALEKIKNYSVVVIDGRDDNGLEQVRNTHGFFDIKQRLVMISQISPQDNQCKYIEANDVVRGWEVVAILR
ncbi:hypothetical protein [Clostridium botulinum]|uniref:hypothetical protein n=1 Tax=Clostridium botulinum TaxID=1491 RepID=UPI0004DA8D23|nr:hypothetical protein [Clostridium botulinum]KEH99722.1 putative phage protein [Clostridium botulinum C/D str. BKT75002]KEI05200.1 hypothetical protein Z954_0046 [Clostridium botulinum C/D str. BKT2873]QPW62163.1 hypothetical protein IG390_13630 [Clostridium botulinum]